jgi:hypothetical protein
MSDLNAPARPRSPRAVARPATAPVRLLAIEVRRNALPWMLPIAAALLWFDAVRTAQSYPPVWGQMSAIITDHVMVDVGPFAAGLAAWIGAREHRYGLGDLLATTARPRWVRQLAAWAATTAWALLAYAGAVGVIFGMTAQRATWGSPQWWPVAVAGSGVALFVTIGFAAGAMFPSRFTAPLAVIGTTMVSVMVFQAAVKNNEAHIVGLSLLSPNTGVPPLDSGVFYPIPADLFILQVVFLVGAIATGVGALGLPTAAGGTLIRRVAATVTAAGVLAAGTALVLVSTAHYGPHGVTVAAIHDAATDRPIVYTPVCAQGPVPVCVHPAFRTELTTVDATFAPVLSTVAGLPGAPVRVTQVNLRRTRLFRAADQYTVSVTLTGPALEYAFGSADAMGSGAADPTALGGASAREYLRTQAASEILTAILGAPTDANPAGEAVTYGLLTAMGIPTGVNPDPVAGTGIGVTGPAPGSAVATAAQSFAALPAAVRSAWLISHLAALRSGHITLAELP